MLNEYIKTQVRLSIKKTTKNNPEFSKDQIYQEVYNTIKRDEYFTDEEMLEVGKDIESRLSDN